MIATTSGPITIFLNPGANPFELLALLLFALPSVFTLQKFVLLDALTERSHQLQVEPSGLALLSCYALGVAGASALAFW